MKRPIMIALLLLGGCAGSPTEADYCRGFGIEPGNPEYARCTQYYFEQDAAFRADGAICAQEADMTYPQSLYSRPTSFPVRVYGARGGFPHTEMVHVGADYQQIAQVDALRMRIIAPCMQKRGWVSPTSWQAGRTARPQAAPNAPLPWQKR